jgi:hypothetical protein
MNQEESYVEGINDLNRINNSRQNGFGFANTQFASRLDPFGVFLCGPLRSLRETVLNLINNLIKAKRIPMSRASANPIESKTPCQMDSFLRLPETGLDLRIRNSPP